jgi:extracellular factor (EF) 3-hydroxypalmitic acid methyl ester biosynthesis protein
MGLFDYLTAPVATAVLKKLYNLLRPRGEMVIGNMHSSNRSKYFMAYWHDWKIIHRSEDDFLRLASDLPGAGLVLKFDDSRIQMMLCIRKQEEGA